MSKKQFLELTLIITLHLEKEQTNDQQSLSALGFTPTRGTGKMSEILCTIVIRNTGLQFSWATPISNLPITNVKTEVIN